MTAVSQMSSTSSELVPIVGRTEPRLWTPPLRELTPETSYGFDVITFARDKLGRPLDPWQEWLVIHAGELLEDGRPRFRKVLVLVARQNGKTELLVILSLFWLFVERVAMVLGTSTKLEYAVESWKKACRLARKVPDLAGEIPTKGGIRKANGEQVLWRADEAEEILEEGSRYKIAASNEEGGRSLTIDRLVLDELRQHHDYSAHDAAVPATNAVRDAQIWAITNAGSERSVVLIDMREAALTADLSAAIDHRDPDAAGDPRLGIFEWSAPPGSSPLDLDALAMANPNLGHRIDPDALLGDAKVSVEKGGEKLAGFKTENMCMFVKRMDPAIDPDGWTGCFEDGTLDGLRDRVALVMDMSIDGLHATLYAAAVQDDGRVRVDVVRDWSGRGLSQQMWKDLPAAVARIKPRAFGWLPNGPAAAVLAKLNGTATADWPPRDVVVEEIRSEVTAVCMGFAALVDSRQLVHSNDPLLNAHAAAAEKLWQGDAWRFTRRGAGHVDATYAAAGAAHLAQTLPAPIRPRVTVL